MFVNIPGTNLLFASLQANQTHPALATSRDILLLAEYIDHLTHYIDQLLYMPVDIVEGTTACYFRKIIDGHVQTIKKTAQQIYTSTPSTGVTSYEQELQQLLDSTNQQLIDCLVLNSTREKCDDWVAGVTLVCDKIRQNTKNPHQILLVSCSALPEVARVFDLDLDGAYWGLDRDQQNLSSIDGHFWALDRMDLGNRQVRVYHCDLLPDGILAYNFTHEDNVCPIIYSAGTAGFFQNNQIHNYGGFVVNDGASDEIFHIKINA